MVKEEKRLIYSLSGLVTYANEQFKQKKTGKIFEFNDVENYVKRGYFPRYLGGNVIKVIPKDKYGTPRYEILEEKIENKSKYKYHKNKYE